MPKHPIDIKSVVTITLAEDVGSGDLTAKLIPEDCRSTARIICRQQAVLCGSAWFDEVFNQLDANIKIDWHFEDGQLIQCDDCICELAGSTRSLLTGERSALNFLQMLSGTATTTHEHVQLIKDYASEILDTRKTIPGLRTAQKYAVACGGGRNHRIGLFDAILIKENHIMAAGSITSAVQQAKSDNSQVEVEVENLEELEEAISAGADIVLLDNFSIEMMKEAVKIARDQVKLEASGGVDQSSLIEIAKTGVDFISIGGLTKHVRAVDFSMRFT